MTKNSDARRVLDQSEIEALIPDLILIKGWVAAVEELIQDILEAGGEINLARLEPKRATRKWVLKDDEVKKVLQKVFKQLGKESDDDTVTPRSVLTVAAAEKAVGKVEFASLLADKVKAESSGFNLKLG